MKSALSSWRGRPSLHHHRCVPWSVSSVSATLHQLHRFAGFEPLPLPRHRIVALRAHWSSKISTSTRKIVQQAPTMKRAARTFGDDSTA
jgi:hypothetical protein